MVWLVWGGIGAGLVGLAVLAWATVAVLVEVADARDAESDGDVDDPEIDFEFVSDAGALA